QVMPNSLANPTTLSHSSMRATALALKLSVNFRLFFLIFRDTHSPFAARPTLARVSILGSTPRRPTPLSLNACGAAFGQALDLIQGGHRCVAGEGGQQRTMCPAETDRLLGLLAREQTVEEARCEAIAATDAVVNIQFHGGGREGLPVNPGNRAPAMAVG